MLGFSALAEVALAEVPGFAAVPSALRRALTGKVFIVNQGPLPPSPATLHNNPFVNESCAMIFTDAFPHAGPFQMLFTSPNGVQHFGDPQFMWQGSALSGSIQAFLPDMQQDRYVIYLSGVGEFDQAGLWVVEVIPDSVNSGATSFMFDVVISP